MDATTTASLFSDNLFVVFVEHSWPALGRQVRCNENHCKCKLKQSCARKCWKRKQRESVQGRLCMIGLKILLFGSRSDRHFFKIFCGGFKTLIKIRERNWQEISGTFWFSTFGGQIEIVTRTQHHISGVVFYANSPQLPKFWEFCEKNPSVLIGCYICL